MSQSAVSQSVAELESEYGCKLFVRSHNQLELTYAGHIFCEYAEKMVSLTSDLKSKMQEVTELKTGNLNIGASTTIGTYIMPALMVEFKKLHPKINLSLVINNSDVIEQMVLDCKLDIGFVEGENYSSEIEATPLLGDELRLICAKEHHWVQENRQYVTAADLEQETIILREKGSGTRKIIEHMLEQERIKPEYIYEMHNIEAIKNSVKNNLGITFLSQLSISEELETGKLVLLPFRNNSLLIRNFSVIIRDRKYKGKLLESFLEFAKNSIQ